MHFHLPKPLHGWRELVGEVGIIVIGVLVALGAEQAVEAWHAHNQAEEARTALRSELGEDNLPQAYARLALVPCIDGELKQLQFALDNHVDRRQFVTLARSYKPPLRTWDDQAWNAVIATGVLSRGGARELIQWSAPYRMISMLRPRSEAERADTVTLRSISNEPGELTSSERDRGTVVLEHLRSDETIMANDSKVLIETSREAGIMLTQGQTQQALRELQQEWGSCVRPPNIRRFDTESQTTQEFKDQHPSSPL
jgi:hypothetical protein